MYSVPARKVQLHYMLQSEEQPTTTIDEVPPDNIPIIIHAENNLLDELHSAENQELNTEKAGAQNFQILSSVSQTREEPLGKDVGRDGVRLMTDARIVEEQRKGDKDVSIFKQVYDRRYEVFKTKVMQKFALIRQRYLLQFEAWLKQKQQESENAIRLGEENLHEVKEAKKLTKRLHKKTKAVMQKAVDDICYRTLRSRAFDALKTYYCKKKYLRVKNAYGCNRKARNIMRVVLKEWALVAHNDALQSRMAFKREYERKQRAQFTDALDIKLEHLKLYATQLQARIAEEQESIASIEKDYKLSVTHGTEVLEREAEDLKSANSIVGEINFFSSKQFSQH